MKNKKILIALLMVVGLLGAFYVYREYNRAPVDTAAAAPDAELREQHSLLLLSMIERNLPDEPS